MDTWSKLAIRYLAYVSIGHLVWEVMQLPLYTLWLEASQGEIAFAIAHCTAGDIVIAASSVGLSIVIVRQLSPASAYVRIRIAVLTILFGVAYTVFSEWMNVHVHGNWAYSSLMPTLPVLGTGLAPLAQWIIVPLVAYRLAVRSMRSGVLTEKG